MAPNLIIGREAANTPEYLTLDEALENKLARVTEVGEEAPVSELRFKNLADKPVLLVDGEELVGAKQNRVLNWTILVPAGQDIAIPVSCVEAGRWRYSSRGFRSSEHTHFATGRSKIRASVTASMHDRGVHRSNQSEVWSDISEKFTQYGSTSRTAAATELYEDFRTNLDKYVSAFTLEPDQVGALFFVHGQPAGFDLFDRASTWSKLQKKLLRSHAVDAIGKFESDDEEVDLEAASRFFTLVRTGEWETFPALGIGTDYRFNSPAAVSAGPQDFGMPICRRFAANYASEARPAIILRSV